MLATLAQFKARYGIAGTTDDAAISALLAGISDVLAGLTGRVVNDVSVLEYTAGIVETLSIMEATDMVMLSEETALGDNPAQVVTDMALIISETERDAGMVKSI